MSKTPTRGWPPACSTPASRSAAIALLGLIVTIAAFRVRRSDLDGAQAPAIG